MRIFSKRQKRQLVRMSPLIVAILAVAAFCIALSYQQFDVLDSRGWIAHQQRNLFIFATVLSLAVILPVFALTYHIVRTYRVDAKKQAAYDPNWDGSRKLELLWWGIPGVIILILSVVTWQTTHSLDPFKNIASKQTPLDVQVVAMEWKWLFIYPEQGIASVNYVQFPAGRPVRFSLTADAPMNSFWIPQLGGQVYAMNGMSTKLNLMADEPGTYKGVSANLSGEGFADMRFSAQSTTPESFETWVSLVKKQSPLLDSREYQALAVPATIKEPSLYRLDDERLYDTVVTKYMGHGHAEGNHGTSD